MRFCLNSWPISSGKSTFLNMIGLLDSITDGSIEIEGKDVSDSQT